MYWPPLLTRTPMPPDKDFMSSSPAPQTSGADELDATTAEVLEPDETPTPAWLPLVGLAVLFVALLALVAARPAGTKAHEGAPARASATAEPSADSVVPAAAAPAPARRMPQPAGCAE